MDAQLCSRITCLIQLARPRYMRMHEETICLHAANTLSTTLFIHREHRIYGSAGIHTMLLTFGWDEAVSSAIPMAMGMNKGEMAFAGIG